MCVTSEEPVVIVNRVIDADRFLPSLQCIDRRERKAGCACVRQRVRIQQRHRSRMKITLRNDVAGVRASIRLTEDHACASLQNGPVRIGDQERRVGTGANTRRGAAYEAACSSLPLEDRKPKS